MTGAKAFDGFPGISKGTAVPNMFFTAILPNMKEPGELLAFLWTLRLVQEQRGEARFVSAAELWAHDGARESFMAIGGGEAGLIRGLTACTQAGALLTLELQGPDGNEYVYFINNPGSRQAVMRARAGELALRPATAAVVPPLETRPGIFRMYEEHVGTITPFVGERLIAASEAYSLEWIERAFREAAELNVRNWRYVERTLERWAEEGTPNEQARRPAREAPGQPANARSGYSVRDR